jgi:UDP-N-acetyl-D-glucosamine dehydrogenase
MEYKTEFNSPIAKELAQKISDKKVVVGIMGLGYVGLPLAVALCRNNVNVVGFDIDESKIEKIHAGQSYLKTVTSKAVSEIVKSGYFSATSDPAFAKDVDTIIMFLHH